MQTEDTPAGAPQNQLFDIDVERWSKELAPLDGRSITVLIDLSNKCNLRCRQCYFSYDTVFNRAGIFLSPERFAVVAEQTFPHAHTVYLSAGNEPLTSPHFIDVLRIAGRYQVPDLKFLTNGMLLTPAIADALIEHGVRQVHFSVDGATKETYEWVRRGANFERLCANIRMLADKKRARGSDTPWLQFNVTLMQKNLDELERFVDLAEELDVQRIACRHLLVYDGLDMEQQILATDKARANQRLTAMLRRVSRSKSVVLSNFPDLFELDGQGAPNAGALYDASLPLPTRGGSSRHDTRPVRADLDAPFGSVDVPSKTELEMPGSLLISGWALDRTGVCSIEIARRPVAGESAETPLLLGRARILNGLRPDVALLYPEFPARAQCAWSFELERSALPATPGAVFEISVIARNHSGATKELGRRRVRMLREGVGRPFLYCRRPFESVYVDYRGDCYPYPDCQTIDPFGVIDGTTPFRSIWFGDAIAELRRRIIERDPPRMCLSCPDLINRNVDNGAFFKARTIEGSVGMPFGCVDLPADGVEVAGELVQLHGWALGFEDFAGVWIALDEQPERRDRPVTLDGLRELGWASFHDGTRPDVAAIHHTHEQRDAAGWSYALTRRQLPQTSGEFVLHAIAANKAGTWTHLGARRILFVGS